MSKRIVAVLHPGDMGSAIGACAVGRGARVLWCPAGRSEASRSRAVASGFEERPSIEALLAECDTVLSICPPDAALELARMVAGHGYRGRYVDANAIAPETSREIGRVVSRAGARYVDGGIIGPPPGTGRCVLYLAGEGAEEIAALFAGSALHTAVMREPVGAASAVKACYAAWTKGSIALLANIRALAEAEGVTATLLEEWTASQPQLPQRSEAIAGSARKAWRWIGEMDEIAASFRAAHLPDGFHQASSTIYARLEAFKDAGKPPALATIIEALRARK